MDNLVADERGALVADTAAALAPRALVGRHIPGLRLVSALPVRGSDAEPAILTSGLHPVGNPPVHVSRLVWAMPD